jgi:hypothetical protein
MTSLVFATEYLWVHFCVYTRAISAAIKGVNLDVSPARASAS